MAKNFSVALSLLLDSSKYTQALKGAANATQGFRTQLVKAFAPIAGLWTLTATIKQFGTEIYNQTKKLDSLSAGFKTVITDSDELSRRYTQLNAMAEKYGISINTLKQEYLGFAAASKGTALEGDKAFKIFNALTSAMSKLGASEETSHRALLAVTQMMSKGTIQSEELRGQLGEALPGAFNAMARALGVSTQELGKMLKAGDVLASDALPKLAEELNRTFGGDFKIDTLTAAQGRFSTAITETIQKLQAGDLFKGLVNSATAFVKIIGGTAKGEDFLNPIMLKVQSLVDWFKILGAGIVAAFSSKAILGFIGNLSSTEKKIKLLTETMNYNDKVFNEISNYISDETDRNPKYKPDRNLLNSKKIADRESAKAKRELDAITIGTSKLGRVMSMLSPAFLSVGIAAVAWIANTTGMVEAAENLYDELFGLKEITKKYNEELATEQSNVAEITAQLNKLKVGSDEYKSLVAELINKYPSLNKYLNENTGELKLNEAAYKALNDEILRGVNARGLAERKQEVGVSYGKTVGKASNKILDFATSGKQRGELAVLLNDIRAGLRDASITADEARKKVVDFLGSEEIYATSGQWYSKLYKITAAIENIAKASERLREENKKAEEAFPVIPLSAAEQAEKAKIAAEKAAKEKKAKEEAARAEEERAREETFNREKEAIEKWQNEKLTLITDALRNEKITKERFDNLELQYNLEYYEKQLELFKKYGKDTSAIALQIAQTKLKLAEFPKGDLLSGLKFTGKVTGKAVPKEKELMPMADVTNTKEVQDFLNFQYELREWVANANEALASFTADTLLDTFDAIGQELFNVGDGFDNFGYKILENIGSFLQQLGAELVTMALLYGAFNNLMKNPATWPIALGVGIAAIAAGAAFKALGAKGLAGVSGASSSTGASSYTNPVESAKDNKVIFEIKGNVLQGVLDNNKKRDSNFR